MAHIVDSSVWVALFLDFDTQHTKAARLFPTIRGTIYIPYCVANEVATILAYKHSKKQANLFLEFIESSRDIVFVDDVLAEEIPFYTSLDSRISFTDVALILLSKKTKAELVTFDRQLLQLKKRMG